MMRSAPWRRRKLGRMLATGVLLSAALLAGRAAQPGAVVACSCVTPDLATYVGKPRYVVVTGVVHGIQVQANGSALGRLTVERVFQGSVAAANVPIGDGELGMCTIGISDGLQLVAVTTLGAGGLELVPCGPAGDVRDASGRALLAEVQARLGGGWAPGEDPPPAAQPGIDLAAIAIGAVSVVIGLVVLVVLLNLTRRRDGVSEPPS